MSFSRKSRTTVRLKIVVLVLFLLGLVATQSDPARREISGQVPNASPDGVPASANSLPPNILIDEFDKTVQQRFLHAPSFGIRRIMPVGPLSPENPHFDSFRPGTPDEVAAVSAFELNGWNAGIYLYGRKVTRRTDTKKEKYNIRYRLFDPIPVAGKLNKEDFPNPKNLVPAIKEAFVTFQKTGSPNENELRIEGDRWSYVMRPVRAVQQSCLVCHKDYVITDRLGNGKFTARKRRLGDANGILVYAFKRNTE